LSDRERYENLVPKQVEGGQSQFSNYSISRVSESDIFIEIMDSKVMEPQGWILVFILFLLQLAMTAGKS